MDHRCLLSLCYFCDFAYYVFGQEPAVAMHLALWYVVLVCHRYNNNIYNICIAPYNTIL